MTAEVTQILKLYEELNFSIEDIAEDREIEISSVKAILAQYSAKYQRALGEGEKHLDFDDSEGELAVKTIANIMLSTDDDNLKFRAAKFIRQDKKGRLDVAKNMKGLNINVFMFNEQMKRARASQERTIKVLANGDKEGAPIDVVEKELENA